MKNEKLPVTAGSDIDLHRRSIDFDGTLDRGQGALGAFEAGSTMGNDLRDISTERPGQKRQENNECGGFHDWAGRAYGHAVWALAEKSSYARC